MKYASGRRALGGISLIVVFVALATCPAIGATRAPSRYFEVHFIAGGTLDSSSVCTATKPCNGDYLTDHAMAWGWSAYALVVATQHGPHTEMHLIGPQARVAAYFNEKVSWSKSEDCTADFSTGGGLNLDHLMATKMFFEDKNGLLSVDVGPPMSQHFSQCGSSTVSTHGRDFTYASWDGLDGPWHYAGVRGPTRAQVRSGKPFVDLAYNGTIGGEHVKDGWLHSSCCGSNLTLVFTPFPGGKKNVLSYERSFARKHPLTSHGFAPYDLLHPTS
jgi:hypothetical protein